MSSEQAYQSILLLAEEVFNPPTTPPAAVSPAPQQLLPQMEEATVPAPNSGGCVSMSGEWNYEHKGQKYQFNFRALLETATGKGTAEVNGEQHTF